jgi:hypothetical protein
MYGPVIQGKLVRLRPPKPEDAAVMIAWFEDLETNRFLGRRQPAFPRDGEGVARKQR